ncbi:MAG TPA: hypothetical protein VK391_09180 [Allosphingosinicella sp.]|nr:hypothetical protein [Allosphingosinicella sp.]
MLAFLLMLMVQSPMRADPLTLRIYEFCKSKPNCVAKQRQGVRQFLDIMTRQYVPRPKVEACLDKSTKKKVTDWEKASACMRRMTGRKG